MGVVGALLLLVAWLAVRAIQVRNDLADARAAVGALAAELLAGDTTAANASLAVASEGAAGAHRATADPIWSLAAHVPFLGRPFKTTAGLASATQTLTRTVLPGLVETGSTLSPSRLHLDAGTVNLTALQQAAAPLGAASVGLRRILATVDALPGSTFVGAVDDARDDLARKLHTLDGTVQAAAVTAAVGPALLGGDGVRHYFVAFQNNAEARATGGIVGAYGILTADHGHLAFTDLGSDANLVGGLPPAASFGDAFARRYNASGATTIWQNANLSANFPYAARVWMGLWQEQTGQALDGAIATDPVALSYLLGATGPVELPNGDVVTSQNAVQLSESAVYARFTDLVARKSYLQQVSKATTDAVLAADSARTGGLLTALRRAAGEHRLMLYSDHPGEQAQIAGTVVAGRLPRSPRPTAMLVVNNASGSKLDYYLTSRLDYRASSCIGQTRRTTATIALANNAPKADLPSYVTIRGDTAAQGAPLGSEILLASYYATPGAEVTSATLDGRPQGVNAAVEDGYPIFTVPLSLQPGQTKILTLHLQEPVAAGPVFTRPQPLVQPQAVDVASPVC